MKLAILILPAFAMLAFAQEPTASSSVQLESTSTEVTQGAVRVIFNISAVMDSPGSLITHDKELILDLPGVTYGRREKRLIVNQNGVRDLLVSIPRRNPPLTRITIRMSGAARYALSTDGLRIILDIHATEAQSASQPRRQRSGPIPTARSGGVDRIFRRAPKQQVFEPAPQDSSIEQTEPAPLPPIRFPEAVRTEESADTAVIQPPAANLASGSETEDASPIPRSAGRGTAEGSQKNTNASGAASAMSPSPTESLPVVPNGQSELIATGETAALAGAQPANTAVEPSVATGATSFRAAPAIPNTDLRTFFHIKFVQQDVAYIDAGRNAGLAEGMKLLVADTDPTEALPSHASAGPIAAELTVVGIAETSAVTEIRVLQRNVLAGDVAYLSDADLQALVQQHSLSATRKYPAVISFTDGDDALDQEARVMDVPRPPLPSVNRMQGRMGFDYFGTHSLDSSRANGKDLGVVLRANFTRIGGTYWNFLGYYRGTIDSTSAASQATLQQVINRTYHLGLTYDNPAGHWVAGFARLYLPWASSLDTLDGGYFGRRIHSGVIIGVFAGSTPDPTSWNYNPNRRIGGTFVNFSGGSFDGFHYSSTSGAGISLLIWAVDRPFLFLENSLSYKRSFAVYSALQADSPAGNPAVAAPGPGIGRSLFTMRWSPVQRLQLDFNHTYFRDIPTFDPALVGTGLLDKYLFQGFSGGARLDIMKQIAVYTELGRSNRTGDSSVALNKMYGITFGRVPWLNLRADAHYSRFNSSFGSGSYRTASLSRTINERLRLEILAGDQAFVSTLAGNQTARFITATMENDLGSFLFTQAGFTLYRGQQQNYNQWMLMMGYRFDSKWKRK